MKQSKRWHINKFELERVGRNALIFIAPVAIVVLGIIQRGGSLEEVSVAVQVWGFGVALDFFRKFAGGK